MNTAPRQYIAIDLKSFYASVECVERGLDPLDACLVVADASRTQKTICLAVSPALKAFGIGGRPRLFEVESRLRELNRARRMGPASTSGRELADNPSRPIGYLVAPPRMALYLDYSARIYGVYLRYVAPEDIHVYSIDEVFVDATAYLQTYGVTAHELAMMMIRDVLQQTGITATAGIGSNLYLCKIAMDIKAKKMKPDADGVRIAELDEASYRRELWDHRPLTDFWRVGHGIASKLEAYGLLTMGDVARCSLHHEELLYRIFGVNAELLIDHAWGYEPVTMPQIRAYRPETRSVSSGQVLQSPYDAVKARAVVMEMADALALDLFDAGVATDQIVITVGYDVESLTNPDIRSRYNGRITTDHYGRKIPYHSHGTSNLPEPTSSARAIVDAVCRLFDRIVNPDLLIRRLNICANRLNADTSPTLRPAAEQLNLFTDYELERRRRAEQREASEKEKRQQRAMVEIKKRFGKNAILKGLNYADGATQRMRNGQIGGHKA